MKIIVIGATGHIGTYLVPMLGASGHDVVAISRGNRKPYTAHAAFGQATCVELDRSADERAFVRAVAELNADVVIDLICFSLQSCVALAEALRGSVSHFLMCGTIWIHGPSASVPMREEEGRNPFGDYGIQKLEITEYLESEARKGRIPATIVHPGHIVGPGWIPLNPEGHFNGEVFRRIGAGEMIRLPNFGMETVHHVHAEDVAGVFLAAVSSWSASVGESFHAVSPAALTLRGYAESVYAWYGKSPSIEYLSWDDWIKSVSADEAQSTRDHIAHSPNCSMEKAARLLRFRPKHSSLDAVFEAVGWLREHNYRIG